MPLQGAAPFAQVDPHRTGHAARADADMAVETPVLGGNDRVFQMGRHGLRCHHPTELIPAPCKDTAFVIQQRHRTPRTSI